MGSSLARRFARAKPTLSELHNPKTLFLGLDLETKLLRTIIHANVDKPLKHKGYAMKKPHICDLSMEERAALFAQAGRDAVARALNAGLPVTGLKDGKIVKRWPDGREEVLKDLRQHSDSE